MANNNERNNKSDSIFKTAVIGAPIAIGAGMGLSTLRKNSSHFGAAVQQIAAPDIPNPNADVAEFANRYVDKRHAGVFKEWQLKALDGISKNVATPADDIKAAMTDAVRRADPSGSLYASVQQRVLSSNNPKSLMQDFTTVMRESSSIYAERAASGFLNTMNVFENRLASNKPISFTASAATVPRPRDFRGETFRTLLPRDFSPGMKSEIRALRKQLGPTPRISIREYARVDKRGAELSIRVSGGEFGRGFNLKVPRVDQDNPAIITSGTSQQSKYIAGRYGIVQEGQIVSTLNHEEWAVRRATEELIPAMRNQAFKGNAVLRGMASEFNTSLLEAPEWFMSADRGMNPALDKYVAARSGLLRLHDTSFAPLNDIAFADLFEQGGVSVDKNFFGLGDDFTWGEFQTASKGWGLGRSEASNIYQAFRRGEMGNLPVFPGFSPSHMGKSVASTIDLRSYGALLPSTSRVGRRPGQFLRQSPPTDEAVQVMAGRSRDRMFKWARAQGVRAPMLSAAYVSSEHAMAMNAYGITAEGQFMLSEGLEGVQGFRKWRQFDVATDKMLDLADIVDPDATQAKYAVDTKVGKGFVAGQGPTGKMVGLPEGFTIQGIESFEMDRSKGNFTRVIGYETINNPEQAKYFGGMKGMGVRAEDRVLTNALGSLGIERGNIEMVAMMDEFKKARHLHHNQMLTSLWEFTKANMDSGMANSEIASNFGDNPMKVIRAIEQSTLGNHEAILDEVFKLSREANLSAEQVGRVFGAVPDVFGADHPFLSRFSQFEAQEIQKRVAFGSTQLFFEDIVGPGSGKMATIEPRFWEFLHSPHLGDVGTGIRSDIASRMMAAYPDRLYDQRELGKSLESMLEPQRYRDAISAEIAAGDPLSLSKGANVRTAFGDIFVPGTDTMRSLAGYTTATGTEVESQLMRSYNRFFEAANLHEQGGMGRDALVEEFEHLQSDVGKARIGTVTGAGGILRNRMPGSVQLTALQKAPQHGELVPGEVGVTKRYVRQMFEQMEDLNLYDSGELSGMKRRMMAGEAHVLMGRHPFIGPYGIQPAKVKIIPGREAVAVVPERYTPTLVASPGMGMDAFNQGIRATGAATEGVSNVMMRTSQMIGLAGDYDGDVVNLMLADPRIERQLAKFANTPQALEMYEDYSLRSQLLKAKAIGDDVTNLNKLMAGDALKMGVTQSRLGKVSSALQKYRAAILSGHGGLGTQQAMDALGLLEWMEQTPISSKHIAAGSEKGMVGLFERISESFEKRSSPQIQGVIREVMAAANETGQMALDQGFLIAQEGINGQIISRHVPGLAIGSNVDNLVSTTNSFIATKQAGQSLARAREVGMGNVGRLNRSDLVASMASESQTGNYFSSFLSGRKEGFVSKISSRFQTGINRLAAAGQSAIPLAKKVGLGFGVAVGLAMALSSPRKSLGPGANTPPHPNMRSGTGGADLPIHPHSQIDGSPTSADHSSFANTARVADNSSRGYDVSVSGQIRGDANIDSVASRVRGTLPNPRMHTTVRDSRSSLTSRNVANILENR